MRVASLRRWLVLALGISLLGTSLGGAVGVQAQEVYTVQAGGESWDMSAQINWFSPETITIVSGDTVTWEAGSTEFHTVTFLSGEPVSGFVQETEFGPAINPLAGFGAGGAEYDGSGVHSSELMWRGGPVTSYSLTFTQPGTYGYLCLVHPTMVGTVEVVDDVSLADDPALLVDEVNADWLTALSDHALPMIFDYSHVDSVTTESGEWAQGVTAGVGDDTVAVVRFLPGSIVVHEGELVQWTNEDFVTPHTVTFLAGGELPQVIVPVPQGDGPPLLTLSPVLLGASGGDTFDGVTPVSSGVFGGDFPGPATYTLRFTQAGIYDYVCVLHSDMNMGGTITVVSATPPPPSEPQPEG